MLLFQNNNVILNQLELQHVSYAKIEDMLSHNMIKKTQYRTEKEKKIRENIIQILYI